MNLKKILKDKILVFDGAMGTMMQKKGLQAGELPEILNITSPEFITEIHKEYVDAGADVITTNTFQANYFKLKNSGFSVEEIIGSAVSLARKSGAKYVALDVGPSGQMMEPIGSLTFDEAYNLFKQQMIAGELAGADVILLETFSDIFEAKAAILAAKENTSLPVIVSMTYQEDGRTFTGTDPVTATITLQSLGVDAIGMNCSMGPKELIPLVEKVLEYSKLPVIVQANAGLPKILNGETIYDISPSEYATYVSIMLNLGIKIVGGCCGTTPDFIKNITSIAKSQKNIILYPKTVTAVTSYSKTVIFDNGVTVIGERINPTGKPKLKEALKEKRIDYILGEAIDQSKNGADILDINVGLPEIDEVSLMREVIKSVQKVSDLPIQVDSADINAIEAGLRITNGRPLLNSVNGKIDNMQKLFPLVKKYGAVVVALTLDESGIPETAEERFEIAKLIVETAATYGIPKEDILIDTLTLTASAQQEAVLATLNSIKLIKASLGVKTILGVSNVSFGLPNRPLINSVFLAAAMGAGLDAAILNPLSDDMMRAIDIFRVINCQDPGSVKYMKKYSDTEPSSLSAPKDLITQEDSNDLNRLIDYILDGRSEDVSTLVKKLLINHDSLQLIDQCFIPALNIVGDDFEKGATFLPSLMMSAEAVKAGFQIIRENAEGKASNTNKGNIILATVYGDIHDIGKNIAKMLFENYGYNVIDLGKDVHTEKIISAIKDHNAKLVGLSALMTTTVKNMKETISSIRNAGLDCVIMAGGAVLNQEYAEFAGADYYVKDARSGIEIAKKVLD